MPQQTPFHPRTSELCVSYAWKEWAGYHAVRTFDTYPEREYFAFRQAAGLLDVTPLYKYSVSGPDASRFLSYVTVKDLTRLGVGRVTYLCWCDGNGKVLDDGTVTRWDDQLYRLTSADPSFAWLLEHSVGFDVQIVDESAELAALALQGPRSCAILDAACDSSGETPVGDLRFFRATRARIGDAEVEITRTGYTGDLGYEVWMKNADAVSVYDALLEAGAPHGILPCGLDALDITRLEAGFILAGVDYVSARRAWIPHQKSSPEEIGLGWCVNLDREPFLGQAALLEERASGPQWAVVGIEVDWDELEALYDAWDLPPAIPAAAWRESIPVYSAGSAGSAGTQVGYATSGTWSPTLKKQLALVTIQREYSNHGRELRFEWTVEHARKTVSATVVPKPFFDPPRKRTAHPLAAVSGATA